MEGMGERAHGRQRQQRGWPGQPTPSLPGARATPAQPASGGGCLPQPRWAVCATGAGAHQGQTSREGERDIWWMVGTTRGGAGHLGLTHTESQRGRWWTACGQRRVDSQNSQTTPTTTSTSSIRQILGATDAQKAHHATQHSPGTPTTGLRERGNDTSGSTGRSGRQKAATRHNMRREERVTVQGPVKKQQPDGANVEHEFGGSMRHKSFWQRRGHGTWGEGALSDGGRARNGGAWPAKGPIAAGASTSAMVPQSPRKDPWGRPGPRQGRSVMRG